MWFSSRTWKPAKLKMATGDCRSLSFSILATENARNLSVKVADDNLILVVTLLFHFNLFLDFANLHGETLEC